MATHSSISAWRIPWTEEPGRLQSVGSRISVFSFRQLIKKQRHYFADKGLYSQSYGFSSSHVWIWELDHKEGWVLKNCCFWTAVLEKTLESLGDQRRSNQSILKEFNPEYSFEGLMLKLKLQYFGQLMWRADSLQRPCCWERLKEGGEGDERGRYCWRASPNGSKFEQVLGDGERMGKPGMLLSMGWQRVGYNWVTITNHQSSLLTWKWGWFCFLILIFSSFTYLWNHPGLYEQQILWSQYISDAKLLEIWLFIFFYVFQFNFY